MSTSGFYFTALKKKKKLAALTSAIAVTDYVMSHCCFATTFYNVDSLYVFHSRKKM